MFFLPESSEPTRWSIVQGHEQWARRSRIDLDARVLGYLFESEEIPAERKRLNERAGRVSPDRFKYLIIPVV